MASRVCPTCGSDFPSNAPESLCPRCLLQAALRTRSPTGAMPFTPPATNELAPHFPQLQIQGLLGQGGMGAVYKAKQVKLDRLVALKVLPSSANGDPEFAERFAREARALARMQHPHIVSVHDFGEAGGHYYLLLEYVDGMNLRELMRAGRVSPDQVIRVVQALADALQYAHQNEIIHRDIKPENVLIDRQGRVKIADFGLAKLAGLDPAGYTLTGASEAMGTPHYMAPEQLERPKEVDHRADLYSLGVVFYELLTGELPLGRFDPPSAKSAIDSRMDEIVLKCLERDPAKRFQSAAEILAAIEAQSLPVSTPAPAKPESLAPESVETPNEAIIYIGLLAFSLAVIMGIIATKSGWFAFGLIGVEQLAAAVNWRPSRRSLIGTILVMAGVATSVVILIFAQSMWWMIFVIWFWYGDKAYKYFKPKTGASKQSSIWSQFTTEERPKLWVLKAIEPFESEITITAAADLEGERLATIRETLQLPAEERVLAVVPLSDDEEEDLLVVGSEALHFPAKRNDRKIVGMLPYNALPGRKFVNHGRGVFVGDDMVMTVDPDNVPCETVARMLESIREAVEQRQASAVPVADQKS
jgi:serine/threonine protein kinase